MKRHLSDREHHLNYSTQWSVDQAIQQLEDMLGSGDDPITYKGEDMTVGSIPGLTGTEKAGQVELEFYAVNEKGRLNWREGTLASMVTDRWLLKRRDDAEADRLEQLEAANRVGAAIRSGAKGSHNLNDLRLLVRLADEQPTSIERGFGAAAKRLAAKGWVYEATGMCQITEEGSAKVRLLLLELETEVRA